jgi:RND family efflux transporter MFP subunit
MRYITLLMLLLVVACDNGSQHAVQQVQPVKCVTATRLKVIRRDFAALTTADDAVTLAFKLSGRVTDVPVAKGMSVSRGELLAKLDSRDVELRLDAAQAAYNEAQSRLRRAERLLSHDAISEQEVEALRSAEAQARSVLNNVRSELNDTRIVAPFAGVVERVYVDAYQRVASGEPVVRIVDPESSTVGFTAPESLVDVLADTATRYVVVIDAYPAVEFTAVVKSFARTSSDALGFPVSLRLTDVDRAKYRVSPGMTCLASVLTPEHDSHAVVLPLTAIYAPVGEGDYVWVVKHGRVMLREVALGSPTGRDKVAVLSGVEVGDSVVVAGVYKLSEGQRVRIMN